MRLRIATAFALIFFIGLGLALLQVSRKLPETAPKNTEPSFAFDVSSIKGEKALSLLQKFLEISPRNSGTEGAEKAALFIHDALEDSGLDPQIDEFEDDTPQGMKTFRNITATLQGNGESCVVLLSHFDTKPGISRKFTGANDSGSSTALLLHMASAIGPSTSSIPDIVFAFVDGEECMQKYSTSDGLHGSRRLVDQLTKKYGASNIKAAILLDMIGDRDLTVTVPKNSSPELIKLLFKAAREEDAREKFSLYGPMTDDHVPFRDKGIPAIDIIDFQYGSRPRQNDYWHTEEDSVDKISPESLHLIGRVTLRVVNEVISDPLKY